MCSCPILYSMAERVHTALLEYISSGIKHLPDGLNGFVQALYAIGGEAPKFLDPISGVSASG